jgi:uncharacterized protein YheU (UPF0270 family)
MKNSSYGSVENKGRFVVCGFFQKEGTDYGEKFSPLERYT